jgi:hypothetical protein
LDIPDCPFYSKPFYGLQWAMSNVQSWLRVRQLLFEKYRILFQIEDETVHVVHIRHSARKTLSPDDED